MNDNENCTCMCKDIAKIGLLRYSYNKTMSPCGGFLAGAGGAQIIFIFQCCKNVEKFRQLGWHQKYQTGNCLV